ncbi:unnamed protein product [Arctogadus glacialis]
MPATGLAVLISRAKEEEEAEEEEEEENDGDGSYYCHSEHRPQPSHRCQHPGSHGFLALSSDCDCEVKAC